MFQQAFGFVPLAPPRGSFVPSPGRPFLNFVWLLPLRGKHARLHTASRTPPLAPSMKNLPPFRSAGYASRFAHPYNGAAPAAPHKSASPVYSLNLNPVPVPCSTSNGSMLSSSPPVALTIGTVPYFKLYI